VLSVLAASLGVSSARAQVEDGRDEPGVRWSAPSACGDAVALRQATRALLAAPIPEDAQLEGIVAADGEAFSLRLRIGASERQLHAVDCHTLLDAAALVWAMSIDPEAGAQAPLPVDADPPDGATAQLVAQPAAQLADPLASSRGGEEVETATPPASVSEPRVPAPARRFRLTASADLERGALPATSLGGALGFRARLSSLALHVGVRGFASRRGFVQAGSGAHGDVSLVAGSLGLGLVFGAGRLTGEARAILELGALTARGGGVAYPGRGRAPWLALGAGLGAELALARGFALLGGVDLLVPLNRPLFMLDGVGSVHRPARFSVRATLGVSVHFGSRISS